MSATPVPTKLGFLSLEFIIGDFTYWLTSGLGRDGFYFTQLPTSLFAGYPLIPHRLGDGSDYSEITAYSDRNIFQSQNPDCHLHGPMKIATDLTSWPRLSWNEMIAAAMDTIPLADQMGLWYGGLFNGHIIRKIDALMPIADVPYQVTAFLPPPGEGVFAIIGEDYKLPENPNWVTCRSDTEEAFKAKLRQFRVEAIRWNGQFFPVL